MKTLAVSLIPLLQTAACVTMDRVSHTPMIAIPEPSYPRRGANLSVWKWDDAKTVILIDLTQLEGLLICDYDDLVPANLAFLLVIKHSGCKLKC